MIIDFLFQAQLITLLGIILSSCIFGWISLQQSNWKWFQNDAAEPVTALANENTKPTLVNFNIIRCRIRIDCSGTSGSASFVVSMEYSTDNTNWYEFGYSPVAWDYADGLATEGVPTTTYKLTGTNAHKAYFESDSYPETFAVGNIAEIDFTIKPTGNIGNLKTYYFRLLLNGNPMDLVSGKTHPQILAGMAADRRALPLFLP